MSRPRPSSRSGGLVDFFALVGKILGSMLLLTVLVASLIALTVIVGLAAGAINSQSWPTARGAVLGTVAVPISPTADPPAFVGRVRYAYRVEQTRYASNLTDFESIQWQPDRTAALAAVADYRHGQEVKVYYDPAEPEFGVIKPGKPLQPVLLLFLLWLAVLAGFATTWYVIANEIEAWRQRRWDPRISKERA